MESQDFTAGIGDRYRQIRAHFGHSKEALGTIAGVSGTSIGNIEEGKHTPKAESVAAIARKLGVSLNWLLFGEGPMIPDLILVSKGKDGEPDRVEEIEFKNLGPETSSLSKELDDLLGPNARRHLPPLTVAVDLDGNDTIMLVDSTAKAGYISHHLEPEYIRQLPAMSLPLPEFRNGTYRAFRVEGHSMTPTLHNGSVVLCRFVDLEMEKIKSTYVHVVVTREGIVTKRVVTGVDDNSTITLRSDNEEFTPYDVNLREVQELWCVVASLNFQMPAPRRNPTKQLYSFELEEMRTRLEILWKNYTGQQ